MSPQRTRHVPQTAINSSMALSSVRVLFQGRWTSPGYILQCHRKNRVAGTDSTVLMRSQEDSAETASPTSMLQEAWAFLYASHSFSIPGISSSATIEYALKAASAHSSNENFFSRDRICREPLERALSPVSVTI